MTITDVISSVEGQLIGQAPQLGASVSSYGLVASITSPAPAVAPGGGGVAGFGAWAVAAIVFLVVTTFLSPTEAAALSVLVILGALLVNQQAASGGVLKTLGLSQ